MRLEEESRPMPQEWSRPQPVEAIAARFAQEENREAKELARETAERTNYFLSAIRHMNDERFVREVRADDCPKYDLIAVGAGFVGLGNPTDKRDLDRFLCGQVLERVDDIGLMVGREGVDYKAKSQCWRITAELIQLTEFMTQVDEVKKMDSGGEMHDRNEFEQELREVLNERNKAKTRNRLRQHVFASWWYMREKIQETGGGGMELLPSSAGEVDEQVALVADVFDATAQLDVGGREYQEITDWVRREIQQPLVDLVGEKNLRGYLQEGVIAPQAGKTSSNCELAPDTYFLGWMS